MRRSRIFRQLVIGGAALVLAPLLLLALVLWGEGAFSTTVAWAILSTAVAGLSAAAALAHVVARKRSEPLRQLTKAAEQVAAGDYSLRVYVDDRDVIGQLARAFNQMSARLADQFARLDEDRQQLRAVLSSMVEGVVAIDGDMAILFANERAGQLLDFQVASSVGRKLWQVVRHRRLHEVVEAALAKAQSQRQELNWNGTVTKNLTVHVGHLSGSPPRGAVLVFHDTSELRRLERLRQDFVANVSHELKTPLSVIKACAETLIDGAVDDVEYRGPFLDRIAEQSQRLHALILDMLSLARIESGEETYEFQEVRVDQAVLACLERHHARAEARRQQLDAVPPSSDEHVHAWADEEAVGEILDNLVDNAVKYTPQGGRISVRWWQEDGNACLEVQDTGIGIATHDLPRIFERFYRVDKARSRELGGTGLGLSIVKHLVQALQGNIRAASQLGKGTTFTVRLPRGPAA
jgi:two-component system phosphate regulon sensor histidine kinase PhoR